MKINKLKRLTSILHISLLSGLVACSNTLVLDQVAKAEESQTLVFSNSDSIDLSYTLKTNNTTGYVVVHHKINFEYYLNVNFKYKTIELDGFFKNYTIDFVRFNPFNDEIYTYSRADNDSIYIPVNEYLTNVNNSIVWEVEFDGDAGGYVDDPANYNVGAYSNDFVEYFQYSGGINEDFTNVIGHVVCKGASSNLTYTFNELNYLNTLINQKQEVIDNILNNPNEYGLYSESDLDANYNKGFQDGCNSELESNGFMILIQSIFSAPVSMFRNAFNFEIFGINVANLVALLLTIGLVILVVSIFKGKNGG